MKEMKCSNGIVIDLKWKTIVHNLVKKESSQEITFKLRLKFIYPYIHLTNNS